MYEFGGGRWDTNISDSSRKAAKVTDTCESWSHWYPFGICIQVLISSFNDTHLSSLTGLKHCVRHLKNRDIIVVFLEFLAIYWKVSFHLIELVIKFGEWGCLLPSLYTQLWSHPFHLGLVVVFILDDNYRFWIHPQKPREEVDSKSKLRFLPRWGFLPPFRLHI